MTRITIVILFLFPLIHSCESVSPGQVESKLEPSPEASTSNFDTALLNGTIHQFVSNFDKTTKDLPSMIMDRTGHEYYSHEFWYFSENGEPLYFKGEWASETYVGAYYYSFKDSMPLLGYQFSENMDGTGSKIRYDSRMSPFYGYSYSKEISVGGSDSISYQQLTVTDLGNTRKELMGFLKANIAMIYSRQGQPVQKNGSDAIFTRSTPVYIEDVALTPDEEVITVTAELLKFWKK